MNLGGTFTAPFGKVKMVQAIHSCGVAGGISCGFVLSFNDGLTLYFAGDTALFGDMKLLGNFLILTMLFFLSVITILWDQKMRFWQRNF